MKKEIRKLRNKRVVIASHIYATGPALELEEYLRDKVKTLVFIGHPFSYRDRKNSFYRVYRNSELEEEGESWGDKLTGPLFYFRDVILTLWWVVKKAGKADLFVGSDNFLAFLGILLKRIGKVEKVVLYTIDYMPKRFNNPILNGIYYFFDRRCMRECEVVWNVSDKIREARAKKGLGGEGCAKQITVPLGIWFGRIPNLTFREKDRYRIVFMGHLLEKQGLQIVIKALPELIKKFPGIKLTVVGSGPYLGKLVNLTKRKGVDEKVDFLGYIEDHKMVELELSRGVLAVATYKPDPESFTYYADPGKIKNYLAAGLPVLVTDVPPIAKELVKNRCGVIVEYDVDKVVGGVTELLGKGRMLERYGENARKYAGRFDWNKVFGDALAETI